MNIVEEIFKRTDPTAAALVEDGKTTTYSELEKQVDACAAGFGRLANFEGRRIGMLWRDGASHVVIALAILRAGGCLVPLAGELSAVERAVVASTTALDYIVSEAGAKLGIPNLSLLHGDSCPENIAVWQCTEDRVPGFPEDRLRALDPAFVRFSSGTTGEKKGIVLSHSTLMERVIAANEGLGIGPHDRVLWVLPMAHHFAVSIVLYLWSGATTLLQKSHLGTEMIDVAIREGATVVYGSPFHHRLLAATERSTGSWRTLRLAVSTASALSEEVAFAFLARFGRALTQGLGIIEVGLPFLNTRCAASKPLSIGRPLPAFRSELRNTKGTPESDEGELFLSGPGMVDAYLAPWQTRPNILRDGWFGTGDIVRRDADGDHFLLGRTRSVINVGGLKCFPEEIEAVLNLHPGVARARVIGKSHPQFGSMPVAEIIPVNRGEPPSQTSLLAHCRLRLARYKMPIEYRLVEQIELTASGKIKRA